MLQNYPNSLKNGSKWSKMIQNDPKWSKMVQNGPIWSKIVKNSSKWSKMVNMIQMVQYGPLWSKMVQIYPKQTKIFNNFPKLFHMFLNVFFFLTLTLANWRQHSYCLFHGHFIWHTEEQKWKFEYCWLL